MYYVDTSALVAYYCPEALSEKVEAFLTTHLRTSISMLTEVELFSAISRKIRDGNLSADDGALITGLFLSHLEASFYRSIEVQTRHYIMARDWIGQFDAPLRTLDAIHLAIASSESLTLVTADYRLVESAKTVRIKAIHMSVD
ncbi:MAG TPA: type II toxin-antitoxin system VapC family toxin [Syntrophobacteraceae bacterium]|nr:type II toxin-antitoxin system VapC family toxin [Syntrophobacteraceae bacterium]